MDKKTTKEKLNALVLKFKDRKIAVIGDLMLDRYIWGNIDRISPEAPVPVILVQKESSVIGGAGNVANNIVHLGGRAFLIGMTGKDKGGEEMLRALHREGVDTAGVIKEAKHVTTEKTRLIGQGQQIARIDKEKTGYIDQRTEAKIIKYVSSIIHDVDALIVSDYAKGLITKDIARGIVRLARRAGKPVIVDTKPKHALWFKGATVLAPNEKEALGMTAVHDVRLAGRMLCEKMQCDVLITRGANGMSLFRARTIDSYPAQAREVFDVTGAGDTVVAALALALAAGANVKEAAELSNYAAGIVVGKAGTATVSGTELKTALA